MSVRKVDLSSWKRIKQFEFFRDFSEPFFGITFNVDISVLYNELKSKGDSIFLGYLYCILKTINEVEEFRYRIDGDEVLIYDKVGASTTVAREDNTFGFSYIDFHENFATFSKKANDELEKVKNSSEFLPSENKLDTIHFSSIPWINFTSISHARHFNFPDSIPKISCGKIVKKKNSVEMPISIHVNHSLMDGYHVGLFEGKLRDNLNKSL